MFTARLSRSVLALLGASTLIIVGRAWGGASTPPIQSHRPTATVITEPVIGAPGIDHIEQRPGWSQRLFDLQAGSGGVSAATLTTALREPIDGDLRLSLDQCSVPWAVAADGASYFCAGATTIRIAPRDAIGESIPLDGLHLAPGTTAYLRALLTVGPDSAPGQTATLDYTFTTSS